MKMAMNVIKSIFVLIVVSNSLLSQWLVVDSYLECGPMRHIFTAGASMTPQNAPAAYDPCDSETQIHHPTSPLNPNGMAGNRCYQAFRQALVPVAGRVYESVEVKMGYFQDLAFAHLLRDVRQAGAQVTVRAHNDVGQVCFDRVKIVLNAAAGLVAHWEPGPVTYVNHARGGNYHAKSLLVTWREPGANGGEQRVIRRINGSYNFTPAAWRTNVEAITILEQRVPIPPAVVAPAASGVAVAQQDPVMDQLADQTGGLALDPSASKGVKANGGKIKSGVAKPASGGQPTSASAAPFCARADEQSELGSYNGTWLGVLGMIVR